METKQLWPKKSFAIHVWAPGLQVQNKYNPRFPVVAVRDLMKPDEFILVDKVDHMYNVTLGPSNPLSGTAGRAKCVMSTGGLIRVHWNDEEFACGPEDWYNAVNLSAEQIIKLVLRKRVMPKELRTN